MGEFQLAADQIQSFRKNGHICLRQVIGRAEAAEFRKVVNAAVQMHAAQNRDSQVPLKDRDTYGKAFLKHMNLWTMDNGVREFVLHQRFGKIATELLGVDGVRVYHDQALYKEPGGGLTPWHQDQYYWPVDTNNTVTMWMPLVDITEDMGMLTFASGSHTKGYLGTLPISDESEEVFNKYIAENDMSIHCEKSMQAGDATFHYGWNLHSAPPNSANTMREVITVIWVADGCRVTEPINDNQRRDLSRWMPGLKPGDVVASDLNPVTYHRNANACVS